MIARETRQTASDALWAAIVELAEAGHDLAVTGQAHADATSAQRVLERARGLATLAEAAAFLATAAADDYA